MRVLTVAVHPDDETLGCGGALLRRKAEGASLHWLLITACDARDFTAEQIDRQAQQVEEVRQAYPFATLDWLRLPTMRLDELPTSQLVAQIRGVIAKIRPEEVYLPNRSDVHSDHRVTFQAAAAVLKSFYLQSLGVRRVLACETPSETDALTPLPENAFLPNYFVDVTNTLERKLELMSMFRSEVHPEPLPRSLSAIRALARHRGASNGLMYAEAFMLIRELA